MALLLMAECWIGFVLAYKHFYLDLLWGFVVVVVVVCYCFRNISVSKGVTFPKEQGVDENMGGGTKWRSLALLSWQNRGDPATVPRCRYCPQEELKGPFKAIPEAETSAVTSVIGTVMQVSAQRGCRTQSCGHLPVAAMDAC